MEFQTWLSPIKIECSLFTRTKTILQIRWPDTLFSRRVQRTGNNHQISSKTAILANLKNWISRKSTTNYKIEMHHKYSIVVIFPQWDEISKYLRVIWITDRVLSLNMKFPWMNEFIIPPFLPWKILYIIYFGFHWRRNFVFHLFVFCQIFNLNNKLVKAMMLPSTSVVAFYSSILGAINARLSWWSDWIY